jgi:hypothetical protein
VLAAWDSPASRGELIPGPSGCLRKERPPDEIAGALTGLWGGAKPATWNRNRAAVGSWLAWCADKQHWAAPTLPAAA